MGMVEVGCGSRHYGLLRLGCGLLRLVMGLVEISIVGCRLLKLWVVGSSWYYIFFFFFFFCEVGFFF